MPKMKKHWQKNRKSIKTQYFLSKYHKEKSVIKEYMKNYFSLVTFIDECKATLAEYDDWVRVWVIHSNIQLI